MCYTLHGSVAEIRTRNGGGKYMSYAVVRMQKMKSHDLKGIQFHNQRERESKTNPDIDKEKSKENYDLIHDEQINYNEHVKEIIDSQKTSTRKTRKDAVLVNELLITSDRYFFERLDPAEQKKFFEESFKLFSERYGEQNIAYATVHNDEKTPHLHLGVIPMRDGRLQGKNVFNRQELLWLQNEFPKHMQELGFELERGEKGSDRKHIETQEFKKQTAEKELKEVETDLLKKSDELKKVSSTLEKNLEALPEEKEKMPFLKKETKTVKTGFMKTEEKQTGNFVFSPNHMKKMDEKINAAMAVRSGYERLVKTDLVQENIELRKFATEKAKENQRLKNDNQHFKSENLALKQENSDLRHEIKMLYENTKEFLKERTNDFKGVFKGFIDKVRGKAPKGEFERLYDTEERKNKANQFSLDGLKELDQQTKKQKTKKKNRGWEMER